LRRDRNRSERRKEDWKIGTDEEGINGRGSKTMKRGGNRKREKGKKGKREKGKKRKSRGKERSSCPESYREEPTFSLTRGSHPLVLTPLSSGRGR